MSPNNICQHLCTIQFVSMKIFLQAKMIKNDDKMLQGKFCNRKCLFNFFPPFSSPMPQFVWVMVPRHESRGQKPCFKQKQEKGRNFGNFLIFVWDLEGNRSQSSFFLQCSKTLSASRFTHCYSLKLNATFFFRYDEIGEKRVFEKILLQKCAALHVSGCLVIAPFPDSCDGCVMDRY